MDPNLPDMDLKTLHTRRSTVSRLFDRFKQLQLLTTVTSGMVGMLLWPLER
jgi:hypothetical protein